MEITFKCLHNACYFCHFFTSFEVRDELFMGKGALCFLYAAMTNRTETLGASHISQYMYGQTTCWSISYDVWSDKGQDFV